MTLDDLMRMGRVHAEGECWIWGARKTGPKGYGRLKIDGRDVYAHRVAYGLRCGSVPVGLVVCHSCDMPSCVNPDHLWAGTNAENIQDAARKGRMLHVATPAIVLQILRLRASGVPATRIASHVGISAGSVKHHVRNAPRPPRVPARIWLPLLCEPPPLREAA